jgi:hypothetical protein
MGHPSNVVWNRSLNAFESKVFYNHLRGPI